MSSDFEKLKQDPLSESEQQHIPYLLSSRSFSDLFMAADRSCFFRNAGAASGPLVRIKNSDIEDLEELHGEVFEKGKILREFFLNFSDVRYRVSKIEDTEQDWFVLRRMMSPLPSLSDLKFPATLTKFLINLGKPPAHGLIVISGKTGEGKTTTAAILLQEYLRLYGDVAVTIEDPPETPLHGVVGDQGFCYQTAVENGNFEDAFKRTMRYSPKYIFMGEVRSGQDAAQAIKASINGHLVITTIHAGSVKETIQSFLKFIAATESVGFSSSVLGAGLLGIIHQQLSHDRDRVLSPKLEFLFPGDNASIRAKIRDGSIESLGDDIDRQHGFIRAGFGPNGPQK